MTHKEWSRAKPTSLRLAAWFMYREGRTPHEVIEAIYGVDLPKEAYLFLRHGLTKSAPGRILGACSVTTHGR